MLSTNGWKTSINNALYNDAKYIVDIFPFFKTSNAEHKWTAGSEFWYANKIFGVNTRKKTIHAPIHIVKKQKISILSNKNFCTFLFLILDTNNIKLITIYIIDIDIKLIYIWMVERICAPIAPRQTCVIKHNIIDWIKEIFRSTLYANNICI